jgi:hypothetical protein
MEQLVKIIMCKRFLPLTLTALFLSGCSSGVTSNEEFVCKTIFESWDSVDLFETKSYNFLYSSTGVSQLGDNSESSRLLGINSLMASVIREKLTEKDDEHLRDLARSHSIYQTNASSYGKNLMRNLIFLAKEEKSLRDFELNLMKKSFEKQIKAGTIRIQMRSRCIELGFSNS